MAGRITKYSEPVPFHKTMGTHKLVIMKRIDDDGVGNTNKGTASMTDFEKIIRDHEALVLDFAKRQVEGERTGLEKHDYLAAIEGRAAKLRADGESPQQAFTKVITEDEAGKLLYKALKRAPGSEVKPAPQPAPPSREAEAKLLGPAHAKSGAKAPETALLTTRVEHFLPGPTAKAHCPLDRRGFWTVIPTRGRPHVRVRYT